jgi:hypothetical protein
MDTTDQVQRFMNECVLFLSVLKNRGPLNVQQRDVVKFKLYDLIFEMESLQNTSAELDQAVRETEQSA